MHKKKTIKINEKCKSLRWWCCLFWVLTHALLSLSSASHVFAHSFNLVHAFAGHWGRSCALLCVCGFKADASVCCLPLSIPASSLKPSILSSIHQPAIRPFVHHPLFSVLCVAACWCCFLLYWAVVSVNATNWPYGKPFPLRNCTEMSPSHMHSHD